VITIGAQGKDTVTKEKERNHLKRRGFFEEKSPGRFEKHGRGGAVCT